MNLNYIKEHARKKTTIVRNFQNKIIIPLHYHVAYWNGGGEK